MLFRSDRKSTRLNSSHTLISYAVFCLKKKKKQQNNMQEHTCTTTEHSARDRTSLCLRTLCTCYLFCVSFCVSFFSVFFFFFLNNPAPPEIYPLPLHDALPICLHRSSGTGMPSCTSPAAATVRVLPPR